MESRNTYLKATHTHTHKSFVLFYVLQTGKGYANRAAHAPKKKDATALADEGAEVLTTLFSRGSKAVEDLRKVIGVCKHTCHIEDDIAYFNYLLTRVLLRSAVYCPCMILYCRLGAAEVE